MHADGRERPQMPSPLKRGKFVRFDVAMGPEMYEEYSRQSSFLKAAYAAWWADSRRARRSSHRDSWPAFLMGWWMACEAGHATLLALTDSPE